MFHTADVGYDVLVVQSVLNCAKINKDTVGENRKG